MSEIICPNCNKAFKVDETGYSAILKQVHDEEFETKIEERLRQAETEKTSELQLAKKDSESAIQKITTEKDLEIERLNSKLREKDITFQCDLDCSTRNEYRGEELRYW